MSARLTRLRGLERIRKLQEEMERATLERAVAEAVEVESALRHDHDALAQATAQSRVALGTGDRSEWLFVDAQSEVARSNISRLGVLLRQREAAVAPAMAAYLACRQLHEQAKLLLADACSEAAASDARKTRAEIDEWNTSRWAKRTAKRVKNS